MSSDVEVLFFFFLICNKGKVCRKNRFIIASSVIFNDDELYNFQISV